MTVVLDAQGLTALASNRAYLEELQRRGEWPAIVPSVVLTEALTGDHRRDFYENRLLRACDVRPVDELVARTAAMLRTRAEGRRPSAIDAIVIAITDDAGGGTVLSSDPTDLRGLAGHADNQILVSKV